MIERKKQTDQRTEREIGTEKEKERERKRERENEREVNRVKVSQARTV